MTSEPGITVTTPQLVQIAVTDLMNTTPVDLADNDEDPDQDHSLEETPMKRPRTDSYEIDTDQSVKQILFNINKAICMRLDCIETALSSLNNKTRALENKVDQLVTQSKQGGNMLVPSNSMKKGAVIVGLPQNGKLGDAGDQCYDPGQLAGPLTPSSMDGIQNLGPNVTLITLNTEDDFPSGTWLGDENNPEMRVRCGITPSDLLHIHSNCRTPEKMALTFLDYLFDRETQATSNLSGQGKHGKKQLDPLMIYGIRCHLIHRFGITENDWHRIKQNIDSKCRTAFRRKQRGMPLTVKAFRGKSNPTYISGTGSDEPLCQTSDDDSMHQDDLHIHQGDIELQQAVAMHGDGLPHGEIQILHATPEQISQLQHAQHIQILQGDHVIQVPVPSSVSEQIQQMQQADPQESVQLASTESLQIATVTTADNGEMIIQQNPAEFKAE